MLLPQWWLRQDEGQCKIWWQITRHMKKISLELRKHINYSSKLFRLLVGNHITTRHLIHAVHFCQPAIHPSKRIPLRCISVKQRKFIRVWSYHWRCRPRKSKSKHLCRSETLQQQQKKKHCVKPSTHFIQNLEFSHPQAGAYLQISGLVPTKHLYKNYSCLITFISSICSKSSSIINLGFLTSQAIYSNMLIWEL